MWFETRNVEDVDKVVNGLNLKNIPSIWLTNIDHKRRHEPIPLMTWEDNLKFSKHKKIKQKGYEKYENYDAIEVPFTDAIPSNYKGVMGVPISFIDKYSPEQFEIVGADFEVKDGLLNWLINKAWVGKLDRGYIKGKRCYSRIFIRKIVENENNSYN
jgi:hypothetical protein